jgi:Helix-hairpin-helix motif
VVDCDGRPWRVVSYRITTRRRPAERVRSKAGRDDGRLPVVRRTSVNTEAELEALPVVRPVIARRIIEGRPFRSVEELERVKGIGKKRLEAIRPLVIVE